MADTPINVWNCWFWVFLLGLNDAMILYETFLWQLGLIERFQNEPGEIQQWSRLKNKEMFSLFSYTDGEGFKPAAAKIK